MNLIQMLEASKEDIITIYGNKAVDVRANVLVIEDSGSLTQSDLICVYNSQGLAITISDRISRKYNNLFQWSVNLIKVYRTYLRESKLDKDMKVSFTINREYAEVVVCREDWYKCIEELL